MMRNTFSKYQDPTFKLCLTHAGCPNTDTDKCPATSTVLNL